MKGLLKKCSDPIRGLGSAVAICMMITAVELGVECNTSYDRANDVLTIFCSTLVTGQTITGLQYTVNGGELTAGRPRL